MIPDGFVAHGWHWFNSGVSGMWHGSAVHLAPVENVYRARGGTEQRSYGALCGAAGNGRGRKQDDPDVLLRELRDAERKLCKRCARKAGAS